MTTIKNLFRDEAGATAIEYGLIAALIAVAAIVGMQALGTSLNTTFNAGAANKRKRRRATSAAFCLRATFGGRRTI